MGFLAPWFLAGLAAVGLPVWLHLLRRHKSDPMVFSSLMFFERRTESSIRQRRLRYLLLLAVRAALVAMLALVFAQPFVRRAAAPAEAGSVLVLALDESFSMRQGDRMERARREALALVRAGRRMQVVSFGSGMRLRTQSTADAAEARAAIQSIQAGEARSSYGELARALRSLAHNAGAPLQVHLFSDMQKSSLPAAFADLRLEPGIDLVFHPAGAGAVGNWTVESVQAPARTSDPQRLRIAATLASYGAQAARREVSLVVNGRALASKSVAIPAGGRAGVEFLSPDLPHGLNRCEIRMTPADAFPADDGFHFAIERTEPRRVLFVEGPRPSRARLYLEAALAAGAGGAFTLETIPAGQIEPRALARYAVVVLSDAAGLAAPAEEALRSYLREGGGVWVTLGPAAAARGRAPVVGLEIQPSRYAARAGERFQLAGEMDAGHPSVRRANRWEGVRFYQVFPVAEEGARVLARLPDSTPLLLEKQAGEGRVLVFASTLDNVSNDFPLRPAFVPFVEQTVRYLAGDEDRPSSQVVDASIELRRTRDKAAAVELLDPGGRRALTLEEAARAEVFRLTRAGFYELRRPAGGRELVAVNPDRRESDFHPIPGETLELWRATGGAQAGGAAAGAGQTRPWGLWWYGMLLVLALAVGESILAGRYLNVEEGAA